MRVKSFSGLIALAALLLTAMPVFAHHSFVAEFNGDKEAIVKVCSRKWCGRTRTSISL